MVIVRGVLSVFGIVEKEHDMKLTAREIVGGFVQRGVNLTGIERVLRLPFGSLLPLVKEEGPAPPEVETLLNMINSFPSLLLVAEANFNARHND